MSELLVTRDILDRSFADALGDDAAEEQTWMRACSIQVVDLARALRNSEEVPEDTIAAALLITDVYGAYLPDTMPRSELARRLVDFCGRMHLRPQVTEASPWKSRSNARNRAFDPGRAREREGQAADDADDPREVGRDAGAGGDLLAP
jgi:hypothetical protein